jgi:hypothetical protein
VPFSTKTNSAAANEIAADIDLRCATAFARAALQAVCSLSDRGRASALAALDDEAHALTMDPGPETAAVAAVLHEARQRLARG